MAAGTAEPEAPSNAVLIVAGPTGSGKSALAMDAALAFGGTIVNADSMQVYRELRILTARPSVEDEAKVPHRLYGVLPAARPCSAGHWLAMATAEIREIHASGRLPIIVGGTGLYLKALREGLAPVPPVPARIRNQARALHGQLGGERFRKELARIDAEAAARLPAGDAQRLIRAYEVAMATGRPLAEWQRQAPQGPTILARFATIILLPPRSQLYARLDARFEAMMAAGALEEVRNLLALGLDPAFPAMKAVGVRELASYLHGRASLAEAVGQAQQATRQFAKRQMTWIRHQMIGSLTEFQQYSERLQTNIFSFIRQFLLTTTP